MSESQMPIVGGICNNRALKGTDGDNLLTIPVALIHGHSQLKDQARQLRPSPLAIPRIGDPRQPGRTCLIHLRHARRQIINEGIRNRLMAAGVLRLLE